MRIRRCAFAFAGALCVAGVAQAEMLDIENAGFEDIFLEDGDWAINNVPGWTITGSQNSGTFNPVLGLHVSDLPEGRNAAYANGGALIQELDYGLAANTDYTIGAMIGNRNWLDLSGHAVQLWAGDTLLLSVSGDLTLSGFETVSKMFPAVGDASPLIGEQLRIELHGSEGGQVNFDSITLDGVLIPTPGALALLGLAGIAGRRRK